MAVATAANDGHVVDRAEVVRGIIPARFLQSNGATAAEVAGTLEDLEHADGRAENSVEFDATVLILTALPVEYDAVIAHIPERSSGLTPAGTRYEIGMIDGDSVRWRAAVFEIAAGNTGAAIETTQGIEHLDAELVLFVGVAGGLKTDVARGTVVAATRVYSYEGGKALADGFASRPGSFPTPHRLNQLATVVARVWRDSDRPEVLTKPIAAGEAIVASRRSDIAVLLAERFNDAVAVDMESAGVYEAAFRHGSARAMAIRGISDSLDDKTPDADKGMQPIAAENAAAFAIDLLRAAEKTDVLPRKT